MLAIDSYLSRLGYSGTAEPTIQTLRSLHKKHLCRDPVTIARSTQKEIYLCGIRMVSWLASGVTIQMTWIEFSAA